MKPSFKKLILSASVVSILPTSAVILHTESTDGDLSGDFQNPTALSFATGSNQIVGSITAGNPDPDRDFITFTIQSGFQLSEILLTSYNSFDDVGTAESFVAITSGSFTSITDASGFLGTALISSVGEDFLDDLGNAGPGGAGFTGPLEAGTYSFWHQETVNGNDYAFDFIVEAIPEPSSTLLLGLGGVVGLLRRRR